MIRVKSARALIDAHKFFSNLPDGERVEVPIPGDFSEHWTRGDFMQWFWNCLNSKINRGDKRKWRNLTDEYQWDLRHDIRIIRDYMRGVRWSGIGNLRLKDLKTRYPNINNQMTEE